MRFRGFAAVLVTIAIGVGAARADAAPILTFNEASGTSGANQDQSVGWQFNVLAPILVTGLSWFDEDHDGLAVAHTVGIWNPAGVLLASAVVPAGLGAPLDIQWRTVGIAPLLLLPGTGYIVGGENFFNNTERLASNVIFAINPAVSFVDATFSTIGSGFTRPTSFSVADNGFFGPSFASQEVIPEPASLMLLGSGLAMAAWRMRRKRS